MTNKAKSRLHSIQKWSLVGLPLGLWVTSCDAGDFERLAEILAVVAGVVVLGLVADNFVERSSAKTNEITVASEMPTEKNCSACFEAIKFEAVKCRYCGANVGRSVSRALVLTSVLLSSFIVCSQWAGDISARVQSVDDRFDSLSMPDVGSISSQIDTISSDVRSMSGDVSDISSTVHSIDTNTVR